MCPTTFDSDPRAYFEICDQNFMNVVDSRLKALSNARENLNIVYTIMLCVQSISCKAVSSQNRFEIVLIEIIVRKINRYSSETVIGNYGAKSTSS